MSVVWNVIEALPVRTGDLKSLEERLEESYPHQLSKAVQANRAASSSPDSSPPVNSPRSDRSP